MTPVYEKRGEVVSLEPDVRERVEEYAAAHGMSVSKLVNLILREKLGVVVGEEKEGGS